MRNQTLGRLFKLEPVLLGVTFFHFMWWVMKETRFEQNPYHYVNRPFYEGELICSVLLIVASSALFVGRMGSHIAALLLSGLVVSNALDFALRVLPQVAEVPMFSSAHAELYWDGLDVGDALQIVIAASVFCASAVSAVRLLRTRYTSRRPAVQQEATQS